MKIEDVDKLEFEVKRDSKDVCNTWFVNGKEFGRAIEFGVTCYYVGNYELGEKLIFNITKETV